MYVPATFSVQDTQQLYDFIRSHSFAILVSTAENTGGPPVATHLPLLLQMNADGSARLIGHVARGNPHWRMADGQNVLAVFSGPHAHISAGWYGEQNVVPTWNYVAVHVSGTLQIEQDPARLLEMLEETVNHFEGRGSSHWTLDSVDSEYRVRMIAGIVGFSISIDTIDGCWKLNQQHSEARRNGAIAGLRQRSAGDDLKIADLMESAVRP